MTEKKQQTPEERAAWAAKMKAARAVKAAWRAAAAAESTVVVDKKPKPKPTAKPLRKPAPAMEAPPKDDDGDSNDWLL